MTGGAPCCQPISQRAHLLAHRRARSAFHHESASQCLGEGRMWRGLRLRAFASWLADRDGRPKQEDGRLRVESSMAVLGCSSSVAI